MHSGYRGNPYKVLVTGSADFIDSAQPLRLLERGDTVVGIGNHTDYYDTALKNAWLPRQIGRQNCTYARADLPDRLAAKACFEAHCLQRVAYWRPSPECAASSTTP